MALIPSLQVPFFNSFVGIGPRLHRGGPADFPSTDPPLEFWRFAPGGKAPLIRAPWGETVQPQPLSIAGLAFYNPYDAQEANSARFLEWQMQRATTAVHGRPMSGDGYMEWVMRTLRPEDGLFNWHGPRLPEVLEQPRVAIFALAFYLYGCLAVAFFHELLLSPRLHRMGWPMPRLLVALVVAPALAGFVLDQYYVRTHSTLVTLPLLNMLLLYLSDRLPQNPWEVAALATIPAILLYLLVWWQFNQSEMTVRLVRAWPLNPAA